uniref:Protein turtle homolog A-like n=1 Tax=Hirondellea gigas TaxID=1518452 RepID=A0A2P2I6E6_9CRUS
MVPRVPLRGLLSLLCIVVSLLRCSCVGAAYATNNMGAGAKYNGIENSPLSAVSAVAGGAVMLPCNLRAASSIDKAILVLIFKGSTGTPIYSIDGRDGSLYSGKHWSDEGILGTRAQFRLRPGQQGLLLNPLTARDSGLYRCRVDFKSSPSKNIRINLSVVSPPQHILITSSLERGSIVSGMIGPYTEGSSLDLSCQVSKGNPQPDVLWWEAASLLDDDVEERTNRITRNVLHLARLTKDDFLRTFTCTANNNNLTVPLSAKITLDIAFPPESISISAEEIGYKPKSGRKRQSELVDMLRNEVTVWEGHQYHFTCESAGSRPSAEIVWLKNGYPVINENNIRVLGSFTRENDIVQTLYRGVDLVLNTTSVSGLQFKPEMEDDGQTITCQAINTVLKSEVKEHTLIINVLHAPQVELMYETKIAAENLEEGDTFSLFCHVNAKPVADQIQWALNGVPLESDPSSGLVIQGTRLEVARASRQMTGAYTCAAANSRGVNTSPPISIRVKFAPICSLNQTIEYGSGIGEETFINCTVDSHASPLTFRWAMNRSSEIVDISQSLHTSSGTQSVLRYTPRNEQDFGSLLCWAANDVGLTENPCKIRVVYAGKPEPVNNCKVENTLEMPTSMVDIACTAGWDGGLNQTFTLEIRAAKHKHSRSLATVQHSAMPLFHVKGLKDGEEYMFIITAVNARSVSAPVTLSYTAPGMLASSLAVEEESLSGYWLLIVAIICGFGFIVVILAVVAFILMSSKCSSSKRNEKSVNQSLYDEGTGKNNSETRNSTYGKGCCEHENTQLTTNCYKGSANGSLESFGKPPLLGDFRGCREDCEGARDSGCDTRGSTPCLFGQDTSSSCGDTYFRDAGPYHHNSLTPPPPCYSTTPLLSSNMATLTECMGLANAAVLNSSSEHSGAESSASNTRPTTPSVTTKMSVPTSVQCFTPTMQKSGSSIIKTSTPVMQSCTPSTAIPSPVPNMPHLINKSLVSQHIMPSLEHTTSVATPSKMQTSVTPSQLTHASMQPMQTASYATIPNRQPTSQLQNSSPVPNSATHNHSSRARPSQILGSSPSTNQTWSPVLMKKQHHVGSLSKVHPTESSTKIPARTQNSVFAPVSSQSTLPRSLVHGSTNSSMVRSSLRRDVHSRKETSPRASLRSSKYKESCL